DEWHRALGHLNYAAVRKLKTKNMVRGMKVNEQVSAHQCQAHIQPFPKESQRTYDKIGDMIYSDLWGKSHIRGIGGKSYFISFTD
ncbi:hypothetical protein F5890DRAFT_1372924, partial [Lentinula detonsa]